MARPSKRTPKVAEEIVRRLAHGEPLARICADDHMPDFSTVWRWEREDEEFRKLSTHARELGTHYMADDCIRIADGDGDPADKRIRIDTRLRLIGKWNARKYGDKLDLTSSDGSMSQPTVIQIVPVRPAHDSGSDPAS
ncbi:hypothetical protein ACO2Q0_02670 [Phenylobacterium sp. VNQ135]|uniref:terminase small subunit-like protein n=1 Tax=Phenylobacterium sp. VNQ135 TaxID=3400922 RepID=UPI003BFDFC0B